MNVDTRIALADFTAGLTPESLAELKGFLLAVEELDNDGHFSLETDLIAEPGASYQAIGKRFVQWQREVMKGARGTTSN